MKIFWNKFTHIFRVDNYKLLAICLVVFITLVGPALFSAKSTVAVIVGIAISTALLQWLIEAIKHFKEQKWK